MTSQELFEFRESVFSKCSQIMEKKNRDYTGGADKEDCFHNFKLGEALSIGSTEQGIAFRLLDKFSRIGTFIKKGNFEVMESIEDTVIDSINYLVILLAYIHDKQCKTTTHKENPDNGKD